MIMFHTIYRSTIYISTPISTLSSLTFMKAFLRQEWMGGFIPVLKTPFARAVHMLDIFVGSKYIVSQGLVFTGVISFTMVSCHLTVQFMNVFILWFPLPIPFLLMSRVSFLLLCKEQLLIGFIYRWCIVAYIHSYLTLWLLCSRRRFRVSIYFLWWGRRWVLILPLYVKPFPVYVWCSLPWVRNGPSRLIHSCCTIICFRKSWH